MHKCNRCQKLTKSDSNCFDCEMEISDLSDKKELAEKLDQAKKYRKDERDCKLMAEYELAVENGWIVP